MLTSEDVINFHTYGDAGLPVSGEALLAIQAFPLGCAKCDGRLLAVYSDNPRIMLDFAKQFLDANLKAIGLAREASSKTMDESQLKHGTLLIKTLLQADDVQQDEQEDGQSFSLTAYHLTNFGQNPELDIFHLPLQIVEFLCEMERAGNHRDIWSKIVQRAWDTASKKNRLYEDILGLYDGEFLRIDKASSFMQTYFLRQALRYARTEQGYPRAEYELKNDIDLVSWNITASFLRRVYNMEKERVEEFRKMGDKLADYVSSQNDRRFFREFFRQKNPHYIRAMLIRANLEHVKRGNPPLITLEPYIEVFEEGYGLEKPDWWLARDLVFIRMVERLREKGWLGKNSDVVEETAQENENETD